MRILMIGAGRLASQLAPALQQAGHEILQVFSRTAVSAETLSRRVGAQPITDLNEADAGVDACIFSVTDTALPLLASQMAGRCPRALYLHTAGSMPLSVFEDTAPHYGVFYPMQTFSRERAVDFRSIPVFIEASDDETLRMVRQLAQDVSNRVIDLPSEERRHLHLAAVFACNFANHCYQLSAEILERHGLPFDVMLPLIDETAAKVHELAPLQAQTGPAVRYDQNVMQKHLDLLADMPRLAGIYQDMSNSIHESSQNNSND